MSRKTKRRKSNRSRSRLPAAPLRRRRGTIGRPDDVVVQLFSFEIWHEPMADPYLRKLAPPERDRVDRIVEAFRENPAGSISEMEDLVEEFPDYEKAYNYLANAYLERGERDKGVALVHETRRRFPDYLFALVMEANVCLSEGRPEEVTALLGQRFALPALYPNRRRFHVSEFVGFHGMLVGYFRATGELELAWQHYKMLCDVAPDDPRTKVIASSFGPRPIRRLLERMFDRGRHDQAGVARRLPP